MLFRTTQFGGILDDLDPRQVANQNRIIPYAEYKSKLDKVFAKIDSDGIVSKDLLVLWRKQYHDDYTNLLNDIYSRYTQDQINFFNSGVIDPAESELGSWDWYLNRKYSVWANEYFQQQMQTRVLQAETAISEAKFEAGKMQLEAVGKIFAEKGHLLSLDEKITIQKALAPGWENLPPQSLINEAIQIIQRIYVGTSTIRSGTDMYNYFLNKAYQEGGVVPPDAKTTIQVQPGLDIPNFTAGQVSKGEYLVNSWEQIGKDQKLNTLIADAKAVSPWETAFMKAGSAIEQDIQTLQNKNFSVPKTVNGSDLIKYGLLAIVALKLLRR